MQLETHNSKLATDNVWLPDMDLNHDKQIQSLLCYRYTIGQVGASKRLKGFALPSSRQTVVPQGRKTIAHGVSRGVTDAFRSSPAGAKVDLPDRVRSPLWGLARYESRHPGLAPWAIVNRPFGASD